MPDRPTSPRGAGPDPPSSRSDPAVKQILLQLDEENRSNRRFVIADLDETHVLISPEAVERVKDVCYRLLRPLDRKTDSLVCRTSSSRSKRTTGTRCKPRRSSPCFLSKL